MPGASDDQQLAAKATGVTREPDVMVIDAPSDDGSYDGARRTPVSP